MALKLLYIKYGVDDTHVCKYACFVCVGREGLGARSFLDRNFGAVFWQCLLFFLKKTIFSNENDSSQVLRS